MYLFLPDTLGNYIPCHTTNFSRANLPTLAKGQVATTVEDVRTVQASQESHR